MSIKSLYTSVFISTRLGLTPINFLSTFPHMFLKGFKWVDQVRDFKMHQPISLVCYKQIRWRLGLFSSFYPTLFTTANAPTNVYLCSSLKSPYLVNICICVYLAKVNWNSSLNMQNYYHPFGVQIWLIFFYFRYHFLPKGHYTMC